MSRFNPDHNIAPVLDAAAQWIQRCLIDELSLFTDRPLWTAMALEEVRVAFVDHPDSSSAAFLNELQGQMRNTSPDTNCLMAELLWVLMLFQSNVGAAKKRESIGLVWSWSGESLGMDHSLLTDEVLLGIGNSGPSYIKHRNLELDLLIGLAIDLTRRPRAERAALLSDRERFERWLDDIPQKGYRQFRHMFRYLAFPDLNERITQNRDRLLILAAYNGADSKALRVMSNSQQDDALRKLREKLAVEQGTADLDFYATPLVERWHEEKELHEIVEKDQAAFDLGYAALRERFLAQFPGFESFVTDSRYQSQERQYKDEMVELFNQTVRPAIATDEWAAVGAAAITLLTHPLKSDGNKPQNIVGWRHVDLLRRLDADKQTSFGRALADLFDESKAIAARVDRFVTQLQEVAGQTQSIPQAAQRSFTGFYLTLWDPHHHIFLKTREMQRALRLVDPTFQWTTTKLTGTDVERVDALASELYSRLSLEDWDPKDFLDVQSFLWVASSYGCSGVEEDNEDIEPMDTISKPLASRPTPPLNQILFGPPGTGKTYQAIEKALEILDPEFLSKLGNNGGSERRKAVKAQYDVLAKEGLIEFVTFHQSFSYENFVEGLSAQVDESSKQLSYDVEPGVFRGLCDKARARMVQGPQEALELAGHRIWKLSLGDYVTESEIYDECIEKDMALMGFGANADFSQCVSREDVQQVFATAGEHLAPGDYPITAIDTFVRKMKVGDLIVVTEGNLRFRAIGQISGDYRRIPRDGDTYSQCRDVRWLRVYTPALPFDALMEKRFSQMTIYELRAGSINHDKLTVLLKPADDAVGNQRPRVLIIDEINRGNVSRIFGELITLIEPSKRAGAPEALEAVLTYSKEAFSVPDNVYLIGTMNTADRSLAALDIALRRRFEFVEMAPEPGKLAGVKVEGIDLSEMLVVMNRRIEVLLDRDHRLGHAYFMSLTNGDGLSKLATIFRNQILPLLQEYFFEDWQRIAWVLNDHRKVKGFQFVVPPTFNVEALFGIGTDVPMDAKLWRLDEEAFKKPESYLGILGDGKA